ncbi:MAG: bifunctional DNA primase/polymerase [Thermoguttaceae bacterium]|nr:bifunctional DNA primase/polymerase [Thermoguttaceae bacterium]
MTSPIFNAAVEIPALRALGLNVLPARLAEKRPIGFWKRYCDQFATGTFGFDEADALCVVCGATSGNLEIIDFDFGAVAFDDFCALAAENGLFDVVRSCLQERTQSGGKHLIYRVDGPVDGNRKLARRDFGASVAVGPDVREITVGGKKIARGKDGRFVGTTIETRGAGGICLVSPSPGYSLERGAWNALPVLTREERDALFEVAQLCDNYRDAPAQAKPSVPAARSAAYSSYSGRDVADELRERGVVRESLLADGWTLVGSDARKEYWRRPGKRDGVSASLDLETEMFYCWSTNAPPFEAERTYTPLQFVAARDFDNDLSAASKNWKERFDDETAQTAEPATLAFALGNSPSVETSDDAPSETPPQFPAPVPNAATPNASERRDADRETPDEVPFPPELFECGGLLEEVQRFTNANSIRVQPELAFAGALALVSFLIGRKLTSDRGATTPNLYVVGLGGASSGKNAARETNAKLLSAVDLGGCVVERFESAQALQNMICAQKKILLQQDEFGQELQTTTLNAGPNRFLIVSEMLKLFSNAKSPYYSPRVVAADFDSKKKGEAKSAAYPFLTVYGTTNYRDFGDAITGALLRNGFVARTLFVAGRKYSPKRVLSFDDSRKSYFAEPSALLLERVGAWSAFRDCKQFETPTLFDVPYERDAFDRLNEYETAEVEPAMRETAENDSGGLCEFLGRVAEKARKYALIFAASRFGPNESTLRVDLACAEGAVALSRYETALFRRLLGEEIVESEEQKNIVAAKRWILGLNEGYFWRADFVRRFSRLGKRARDEILQTLLESEFIVEDRIKKENSQRAAALYRLASQGE